MSNPCENSCKNIPCNCEKDTKNDEKQLKIAEFKEKTDKISQISYKTIKNLSFSDKNRENDKKTSKMKNYRVTLTDTGTSDGYFLEYSKEITLFEFATILSEIFDIDIHVEYNEDNDITLEEDIIFFTSLEEAIEFLENKNREE